MSKTYKIDLEFSIHAKTQESHNKQMSLLEDVLNTLNKIYSNHNEEYCDFSLNKSIETDD
jgi:hypothetical protein